MSKELEKALEKAGVFKGADGLRRLCDAHQFWEEQPYGTRLYFGGGVTDYLHRDVLRAVINVADTFLASQQGEQCISDTGSCGVGGYCTECPSKHPEQAEGAHIPDDVFAAEFAEWWEEDGQYCRSGGGDYERTFAFQAWRHLYPKLMIARSALEQPYPAPEMERPEVVATVCGSRVQWVQPTAGSVPDRAALMTVAQHDRIVGALRAEIARWVSRYQFMSQTQLEALQERDAAQAKLAAMEQQEPVTVVKGDGSLGAGFPPGTKLYADPVAQAGQVPDERRSAAQRLREYNHNPHHINPMSESFHRLILEAAELLVAPTVVPDAVREAIKWADHLLFECGALTHTRTPSVHVYNKTYAAVEAAKALLAAAPAQGGSTNE